MNNRKFVGVKRDAFQFATVPSLPDSTKSESIVKVNLQANSKGENCIAKVAFYLLSSSHLLLLSFVFAKRPKQH